MTSSVQSAFSAYPRRIPGGGTGVSSNGCLANPSSFRPPHYIPSSAACVGTANSSSLLSSPSLVSSSAPCSTDLMHVCTPEYAVDVQRELSILSSWRVY